MATNKSLQEGCMLCPLRLPDALPPIFSCLFPQTSTWTWAGAQIIYLEYDPFAGTGWVSGPKACKFMNCKRTESSLLEETFTDSEGKKMCPPNRETPSAALIWQVWGLLVWKSDMNLWRDSLELQSISGAASMKITYVARLSQKSAHWAAEQCWEHL